ncbi:MAG: right-handed parallel beta-helix repeat-containing protein, partial [Deltaproteobacteria bacterium]|nr:right-handed parallel beta-helix repeat-containing protein [Deltaproteobacteria bacterium]
PGDVVSDVLTVDNLGPTIEFSAPETLYMSQSGTISFTLSLSDENGLSSSTPPSLSSESIQLIFDEGVTCTDLSFADQGGGVYQVTVGGCTGDGTFYLSLPSVVTVLDTVGNPSQSKKSVSITVDNTGPSGHSVSIDSGATYTSSTSVTLTLAASDTNGVSQMFVSNSATFASGSWEAFATSKAWTLAQTNATATVYVKFKDAAGNESTGVSDTIIHDSIQPSATITSSTVSNGGATTTSQAAFTVTFSESVTGFISGDVTVGNGSVSSFAGSGTTYTFNLTPTANFDGTVTVNVAAGVASDVAGDTNTAANQYSYTYQIYPTISSMTTKYTEMNTTSSAIAFTINDNASLSCTSSMSFSSSNNSIVDGTDSQKYTFAGTAPNCTVTIVPASNAFGQVTITLTVTDSLSLQASSSFTFKVGYVTVAATHGNAQQWNDYIAFNYATATNPYYVNDSYSAAAGTEQRYHLIRHGGEMKTVDYPYRTSCTGLTASDDNNVFDWVCNASGSNVVFYSKGLASGKYLSNLLTTAPAWDTKQVTIIDGATPKAKSDLEAWWTNTVTSLPDSSSSTPVLASSGTIYVGTTDTTGQGFNINADKIGLVIMPGFTYRWSGSATANFNSASGETGTSYIAMIGVGSQNYLWLEGSFNAAPVSGTTASRVLSGWKLARSQVRNFIADRGSSYGAEITRLSDANRFIDIALSNSGAAGWYHLGNVLTDPEPHLDDNNGCLLENAKFFKNGGAGFSTRGSNYFDFNNIKASNNTLQGLSLVDVDYTSVANSVISNNGDRGLWLQALKGGSVVNTLSIANANAGILVVTDTAPLDSNIFASTAADNSLSGLWLGVVSHPNINNFVSVNNGQFGVTSESANTALRPEFVTLSQVVALQNEWHAIGIGTITGQNQFASDWKITNNLIIGPNLSDTTTRSGCLSFGTNIGFDSSCAATGASDHRLYTGADLTGAFVGKVSTNDATNTSDTNGVATYSTSIDWVNFDSFYRTWTKKSANAFPSTNVRGRWTTGDGQIFDWALDKDVVTKYIYNTTLDSNSADGLQQNAAITTGTCPSQLKGDAANTTTHRSHGTYVAQTYLTHAYEVMYDEIGDDDAACESNEACIYTPNFGAYQGHGSLSTCMFQGGDTITGVTMYFYGTNGY